jgi:MFS family permease
VLDAWPFGAVAHRPLVAAPAQAMTRSARMDFARMWAARLALQIGAMVVIGYFYLYLTTRLGPVQATGRMATLAILAMATSFVSALAAGHWSDRSGRRRPPMIAAALAAAVGLALLALDPPWPLLLAGYLLFHLGLTAFLSVDAAMVALLLFSSDRRGEMLGYLNLTNTLPSIIVPALGVGALWSPGATSWGFIFAGTALLGLVAAFLILRVRTID